MLHSTAKRTAALAIAIGLLAGLAGDARPAAAEAPAGRTGRRHVFTVTGGKTCLDGQPLLVIGLRCSNALISDATADQLIENLDTFAGYGVNTVSVYFMGSRFGDVKGYRRDGSLDPVYARRMGRIVEAADERAMVVLVGCLYWGNSKAKWEHWKQKEANRAVASTVAWLKANRYRNVFVDVDNEGMAHRAKGFDTRAMVRAGKAAWPACVIASNDRAEPPHEADLGIHFAKRVPEKPYIDSEATPSNAPGGYWGRYSKRKGLYNYINIGIYTDAMKANQTRDTVRHLDAGHGYMCASTWLQCPPPDGPNMRPGGDGSPGSPGIRWWLAFVKDRYGPYRPPRQARLEEDEGLSQLIPAMEEEPCILTCDETQQSYVLHKQEPKAWRGREFLVKSEDTADASGPFPRAFEIWRHGKAAKLMPEAVMLLY
jgi:hypothetical protein